ncbi:MAG: type I polyketide synthase [Candidatus Competibacteraceae bacterium]|nr:MAG: type I polyketide synthase [Candidatus Competibacteraceae bacterium]
MNATANSDIAIVGMAALFARAPDLAGYWYNILNRVDAIGMPPPEWGAERLLDPSSEDLARLYTCHGGFLGELSRFDPRAFGIMPVSLTGGEPDQFHALELAQRALADAGLGEGGYAPERTGIILGHGIHPNRASVNGVQHGVVLDQTVALLRGLLPHLDAAAAAQIRTLLKQELLPLDTDGIPGLVPNMMTGRIANRLNLMGPNYILDAACASSLIAVDAAMNELRRGNADLMLAGGINTSTPPLVYMVFCRLGALSRNSRIQPFAAGADGTLLGEGGGVLVLKRLDDALRAGDRIYAVLKAVGQASDGRAKGLMAPRLEGEVLAMRRAWQQAGLDPASAGLIEAHGTGIPLGDQTEIEALRQVLGARRGAIPDVALGSVKSMIGHCIPAAGAAALIKTALALYHRLLPPTLAGEVNPRLGLEHGRLYLNTETRPWIHGGPAPRRAGVNAFGFGGINTHAILEEAPGADPQPLAAFLGRRWCPGSELLVFSQADRPALLAQLAQLHQRLDQEPALDLHTLAAALWRQRGADGERLALVAADIAGVQKRLAVALDKLADPCRERLQTRDGLYFNARPVPGRVALLFPGENSQYPDMLRALTIEFAELRRGFDFLDGLYGGERDQAPSQAIFPPPTGLDAEAQAVLQAQLRGMELGSEAVFAADRALFQLLSALGIRADALLGHSTGENAALVASGMPQLDEAALGASIRAMNALYRGLEADGAIPDGQLLSVGALPLDAARAVLAADPRLHLTMDNCANQFILFGPREAIAGAHEQLRQQGGFCSVLTLDRGYHTPLMAPMAAAFRRLFEDVEFVASATPTLYSCVTAAPFPAAPEAIRDTAAAQYRQPVRFRESIENLYRDGVRVFIEAGPESHLSAFVRDTLRGRPHLAVACDDRRRGAGEQLRYLLGALFAEGVPLDLDLLHAGCQVAEHAPPVAPYLSTAIPLIQPSATVIEHVRHVLDSSTSAQPSAIPVQPSTPVVNEPAAAAVAVESVPTPTVPVSRHPGPATALTGHFELMQDFLAQQERVMAAWLERRRRS